MLNPNFLMTARHVHPGVNTLADYRARHADAQRALAAAYPNLPWPGVHAVDAQPLAFVSGGRWLIDCATPGCSNCPALAPEWGGVALCYDCGASYEGIELPQEAAEIERLLVQRVQPSLRYWNPEHSLDKVQADNAQLGIAEAIS